VACPAGEDRLLDLLIPVHQSGGADERFLSLSLRNSDNEAVAYTSLSSDASEYRLAISSQVYQKSQSELRNSWSRISSRSGDFDDFAGIFKVADLPEDWRAYAGYDALLLNRSDWQAMPSGVRLALDQWVRSGGHLVLLNDGGELDAEFEDPPQEGFGRRSVIEAGDGYQGWQAKTLWGLLKGGPLPLTKAHGSQYQYVWSVAKDLGSRSLQTGLILFALIIFAIIVGPVNLFVWAGKNRRHRLYITTPLISLVASVIMVTFMILRDGFGGEGARAIAIEVGGADDKTAVIVQEQFSRSGILFSSGFTLDDQTVLNPVAPPESDLNRPDSPSAKGTFNLEVSPTQEGWELSGNLFESRSEQAQLVRSVRPSREGLTLVSAPGEGPRLASSFSYSLAPVFFTDGEGKVWKAASIEPGGTVSLSEAGPAEEEPEIMDAVERFGESYRKTLQEMFRRPNSFAALAGEASGVATHSAIDWQDSPVVVTGLAGP
jgi:hypothetical protein